MSNTWYAAVCDVEDNDYTWGSFDRGEAEKLVLADLFYSPDALLVVLENNTFVSRIFPEDFVSPLICGKWRHTDIDVVKIGDGFYALNGWDGEKYTDCWKCLNTESKDLSDFYDYEVRPIGTSCYLACNIERNFLREHFCGKRHSG